MRKILLSAVISLIPVCGHAYEKIEFKGQIINPALTKISAVAVMDGKVLVADAKANSVFIFDAEGKLLKKSPAPLKEPGALSVGNSRIYVADTGNSRVVVLDAEGVLLWTFSGEGSLPGQLDGPLGLAYGPDDRIYVSNTGNSRIEVFNSDGIFLYGFPVMKGDNISKLNPGKIALDNSGSVYVSDPGSSLIVKYDRTGKFLKEYALANDGLVADEYGILYVINGKDGKVREVSESGEVLGTFGTRGKGKTEFLKLKDIAIDADGSICLADEGNKKVTMIRMEGEKPAMKLAKAQPLDRFNLKGPVKKYLYRSDVFAVRPDLSVVAHLPETKEIVLLEEAGKKTLMRYGDKQGQIKNPKGITTDLQGRIYVSDTGNNRMQILGPDGTFFNMFGESGSNEGNFKDPSGVTVSSKGNIYVADTKNKRVQVFNLDGIFLFAVGPQIGNVTLVSPVGVRADNNRNIYILDAGLKKVIVTDASGKFLRIWDDSGNLQNPVAIAYDWKTYFYILDRGSFNVKIFNDQGKFVSSFFAKGAGERELVDPQYIGIADNKLYVADYAGAKILAFELSYLPEEPMGVKVSVGESKIGLSWQANKTPWLKNFAIFRASLAGGGRPAAADFKQLGLSDAPEYSDSALSPDTTYYYSVAGVSVAGDIGARSAPLAVYFKGREEKTEASAGEEQGPGSKNVAPLEILPSELNYIFSANYKYYLKNPIGRISVRNNTDTAFSNVKVSFYLKDFMDFPTDASIPEIKSKEKVEVDLPATLNNRILNITEDTPVQCQLTLTYYQDGAEKTSTVNKPVKVLSKNAIIWDKPSRLANFITPKDTPVFAFSRFALNEKGRLAEDLDQFNDNLLTVLMLWEALGEYGLSYLADPVSPYSVLKSSSEFVLDTVQFPRNTLKLKSGDCDDLTALFAALLEASGVHVALLDYPSHIAFMFDTGVSDARNVGIPEEYLIKYNNTWWVGLEGTMVGKNFYDAIKHEADLYRKAQNDARVIDVRTSWAEFEPVTLPDTEAENIPDKAKFTARAKEAITGLLEVRYEYLKKYFGQILLSDPADVGANLNMGIVSAQYGKAPEAESYFGKVLEREPFNAAALNNMGNLNFNKKEYEAAKESYFKAAKADPYDANIWLNLARVSDKLGKKEDVKTFVERAAKIDPEVKNIGDKLLK